MSGVVSSSFTGQPNWQHTPLQPLLAGDNTICIWRGNIADMIALYDHCFNVLSPPEQSAGIRYHQPALRQRYVIQHGILRLLLAKYLQTPAQSIGFVYNTAQKPYLALPQKKCFFNISYTRHQFLIAVGNVELGIDIEHIDPGFIYRDIAVQYFSTAEVAYINASPNPKQAFFLLWTRKEALLKACGTGIDDNLPAMPALDGRHPLPPGYGEINWLTESFYAGQQCIGSVTYPSPKAALQFFKLDADTLALMF